MSSQKPKWLPFSACITPNWLNLLRSTHFSLYLYKGHVYSSWRYPSPPVLTRERSRCSLSELEDSAVKRVHFSGESQRSERLLFTELLLNSVIDVLQYCHPHLTAWRSQVQVPDNVRPLKFVCCLCVVGSGQVGVYSLQVTSVGVKNGSNAEHFRRWIKYVAVD